MCDAAGRRIVRKSMERPTSARCNQAPLPLNTSDDGAMNRLGSWVRLPPEEPIDGS